MKLKFEPILPSEEQVDVLYTFLQVRGFSISHTVLPSYADHVDFVTNHPYRAWYLIEVREEYIGSIYLTYQNTIGINLLENNVQEHISSILDFVKRSHSPLSGIKSVRKEKVCSLRCVVHVAVPLLTARVPGGMER